MKKVTYQSDTSAQQTADTSAQQTADTLKSILASRVAAKDVCKEARRIKEEANIVLKEKNKELKYLVKDTKEDILNLALDKRFIGITAIFKPTFSKMFFREDSLSQVEVQWIRKAGQLEKAIGEMTEAKENLLREYAANLYGTRNIDITVDINRLSALANLNPF